MTNVHALIIDDNPYNVEVLEHLLTSLGNSVTTLQDPMKLEDVVTKPEQIDIVFLDLEMPKRDGYQMLHILRDDLGLSIPVVAYTVHTSEMDEARALGFDGFLGKPLDPRRFADQLSRLLAGQSVWDIP